MFDFTDAQEQSGFKAMPAGEYAVFSEEAVLKDTKAGTGQYIKVTFKVMDGEFKGRKIFQNFNVQNPNKQAEDIGKGQIKSFMKAGGWKEFKLTDVSDLCGLQVLAKVKIESDDFGEKNTITSFKEIPKNTDIPF